VCLPDFDDLPIPAQTRRQSRAELHHFVNGLSTLSYIAEQGLRTAQQHFQKAASLERLETEKQDAEVHNLPALLLS
jgi:hypothetical protein